jgi:hypothetical protein
MTSADESTTKELTPPTDLLRLEFETLGEKFDVAISQIGLHQDLREPVPCTVESNPGSIRGNSEDGGNLAWGQFLPCAEFNDLTVGYRQLRKCFMHFTPNPISRRSR